MASFAEGKRIARVGDMTTHGGRIITGSDFFTDEGIPVARVGDKVTCPKCGDMQVIAEGCATVWDHDRQIACEGHAVSCGAKLVIAGTMQGGFFGGGSKDLPEPEPGRGLPQEEYCKYSNALKNSKVFQDTIRQMVDLTKQNDVEYSCWFVQDADGTIRAVGLKTDDLELYVNPGDKPEGAIGQVHTHTRGVRPSPDDLDYFSKQPIENRPYVYGIVRDADYVWMTDDEGKELWCD